MVREWNLDLLGLVGTNWGDLHGKAVLIRELSTGGEVKLVGPVRTCGAMASEDIADAGSGVKVVPGFDSRQAANIPTGLFGLDFDGLCIRRTFSVEADLIVG